MPVVAEDRAGRLPVHPRLVRPLSLLPGRQPRSQRHRPRCTAGSTASATRTRRAPASSTWRRKRDEQLIERLHSPNVFFRDLAQRLLCEREQRRRPARKLEKLVLDDERPAQGAHARPVGADRHRPTRSPTFTGNCWRTRTPCSAPGACARRAISARSRRRSVHKVVGAGQRLRRPTCSCRWPSRRASSTASMPLPTAAARAGGLRRRQADPAIVWQNLHPLLEDKADRFLHLAGEIGSEQGAASETS